MHGEANEVPLCTVLHRHEVLHWLLHAALAARVTHARINFRILRCRYLFCDPPRALLGEAEDFAALPFRHLAR